MASAQLSLKQVLGALNHLSQEELVKLYGLTNDLRFGTLERLRQEHHSETPQTQSVEIVPNDIVEGPLPFELICQAVDHFNAPELAILHSLVGNRVDGSPYPNHIAHSETVGGKFFSFASHHLMGFTGTNPNLSTVEVELFKKCVHLIGEASRAKEQGDQQRLTEILAQIAIEFEKVRGNIPPTLHLMLEQFSR